MAIVVRWAIGEENSERTFESYMDARREFSCLQFKARSEKTGIVEFQVDGSIKEKFDAENTCQRKISPTLKKNAKKRSASSEGPKKSRKQKTENKYNDAPESKESAAKAWVQHWVRRAKEQAGLEKYVGAAWEKFAEIATEYPLENIETASKAFAAKLKELNQGEERQAYEFMLLFSRQCLQMRTSGKFECPETPKPGNSERRCKDTQNLAQNLVGVVTDAQEKPLPESNHSGTGAIPADDADWVNAWVNRAQKQEGLENTLGQAWKQFHVIATEYAVENIEGAIASFEEQIKELQSKDSSEGSKRVEIEVYELMRSFAEECLERKQENTKVEEVGTDEPESPRSFDRSESATKSKPGANSTPGSKDKPAAANEKQQMAVKGALKGFFKKSATKAEPSQENEEQTALKPSDGKTQLDHETDTKETENQVDTKSSDAFVPSWVVPAAASSSSERGTEIKKRMVLPTAPEILMAAAKRKTSGYATETLTRKRTGEKTQKPKRKRNDEDGWLVADDEVDEEDNLYGQAEASSDDEAPEATARACNNKDSRNGERGDSTGAYTPDDAFILNWHSWSTESWGMAESDEGAVTEEQENSDQVKPPEWLNRWLKKGKREKDLVDAAILQEPRWADWEAQARALVMAPLDIMEQAKACYKDLMSGKYVPAMNGKRAKRIKPKRSEVNRLEFFSKLCSYAIRHRKEAAAQQAAASAEEMQQTAPDQKAEGSLRDGNSQPNVLGVLPREGQTIEILWEEDKKWYLGTVTRAESQPPVEHHSGSSTHYFALMHATVQYETSNTVERNLKISMAGFSGPGGGASGHSSIFIPNGVAARLAATTGAALDAPVKWRYADEDEAAAFETEAQQQMEDMTVDDEDLNEEQGGRTTNQSNQEQEIKEMLQDADLHHVATALQRARIPLSKLFKTLDQGGTTKLLKSASIEKEDRKIVKKVLTKYENKLLLRF